jgi:vitamin B12 transporter
MRQEIEKILICYWLITAFFLKAEIISGRIISEKGEFLEDAIVSNSQKATVTDKNGFFRLETSLDDSLTISKLGYQIISYSAREITSEIVLRTAPVKLEGIKISAENKADHLVGLGDKIIIYPKSDSKNAAEILAGRADLNIKGINLIGETQNATLSGFLPRHLLVMLDGVPLNKSGEAFDLATIPAEIIHSIDIQKGSSGKSAVGGIININTKPALGKSALGFLNQFGSFGMNKQSAFVSHSNKNWLGFFDIARSFTRNDFLFKGHSGWENPDSLRRREFNDKRIYDLNMRIVNSNKFCTIDYKFLGQDYFKKLPGTILNPDYFRNSRQSGQTWRHFFNLIKDFPDYQIRSESYYSSEKSTYDNTRLSAPYNNLLYEEFGITQQKQARTKLTAVYKQKHFDFDWGADYNYEQFEYKDKLDATNSIQAKSNNNLGIFALTRLESESMFSSLKMQASARHDFHDVFNDYSSWRLATEYTYLTLIDMQIGTSIANGFAYPSFLSLYWKGDTQTVGNPDLDPERSLSWQLYGKLVHKTNFIKLSYRRDLMKDMIQWFLEFNSRWKPHNIGKVEIRSWDIESEYNITDYLKLRALYTTTDARNRTSNSAYYDKLIIYAPKEKFTLETIFQYKWLLMGMTYNYIGKQAYTPDQQTSEHFLSPYDLLNARTSVEFHNGSWHYGLNMNFNNILNKLYEIYKYIPQPGFNWDMGIFIRYEL